MEVSCDEFGQESALGASLYAADGLVIAVLSTPNKAVWGLFSGDIGLALPALLKLLHRPRRKQNPKRGRSPLFRTLLVHTSVPTGPHRRLRGHMSIFVVWNTSSSVHISPTHPAVHL